MNRQFKFRVWDIAKNKFINPFVFERDDYYKTTGMVLLDLNGKIRITDYSCGNGDNSASSVYSEIDNPDKYVIQQYTGFTDSKGNEIYEGDILKNLTPHKYSSDIFIVKWTEFTPSDDMGVGGVGFVLPWFFCMFKPEVIGNIYEHEHLLK